jgi:hypothetical protein
MIKFVLIGAAVLIVGVLIYAGTRPDAFRVQRTASIQAPPDRIVAFINDFQSWGAWSPYEKLDPAMKKTFGATTKGKGAVYEWDGNSKAGAGRMEIVDSSPAAVRIRLDFKRPFESSNTAEFTLRPAGSATDVTWAMYGPSPYVAKLMGIFINMDGMIGKDFEVGLANLKTVAEK